MILYYWVKIMSLIEVRNEYGLSQIEAASIVGVPVRTYRRYECDENYGDKLKRQAIINMIVSECEITETKGVLTIEQIKSVVVPILKKRNINYCYLFGSYSKGTAKDSSDVDLLIDTDITGMEFFGLIEEIRETLHKKIDLLRLKDLSSDNPIVLEILKEGVRIL